MSVILPGATIGMLGGGQLGRMFTMEALSLGYKVIVLEPDELSPAGAIATEHLKAAYDDEDALKKLGELCDVITTEFENIPAKTLEFLDEYCPVRPKASAVRVAQNRNREKTFARELGLGTAPFVSVLKADDLDQAEGVVKFPAILKSSELGYDGKGQVVVESIEEAKAAYADMGGVECVLEERVALAAEVSVVLGRNRAGDSICFPLAENEHRGGILHQTIAPARVDDAMAEQAREAATKLADALEFVGVMAVEFFITESGDLLVNEIAPRTHNSGHYTLNACETSQFEQQVRAICGLPFGSVRQHTPVVMINLLGDVWEHGIPDWDGLLSNEHVYLNLYGKYEARAGRKMGHFCVLADDIGTCVEQADECFKKLAHL